MPNSFHFRFQKGSGIHGLYDLSSRRGLHGMYYRPLKNEALISSSRAMFHSHSQSLSSQEHDWSAVNGELHAVCRKTVTALQLLSISGEIQPANRNQKRLIRHAYNAHIPPTACIDQTHGTAGPSATNHHYRRCVIHYYFRNNGRRHYLSPTAR